ncbi:hypothetical protein PoB_007096000 [Plakobranchus ocellatus]|uniref:Uncharacterized protein n=1 Tax=Plakobranchus ocellatus TaxID=259542 RepID=A0AAV4DJY4_9GAST|nr:hypothetical protein PoB_007096000 [Plakobranchus ocellatus]
MISGFKTLRQARASAAGFERVPADIWASSLSSEPTTSLISAELERNYGKMSTAMKPYYDMSRTQGRAWCPESIEPCHVRPPHRLP